MSVSDDWDRQLASRVSAVLRHIKSTQETDAPAMLAGTVGPQVRVQEVLLREAVGEDILQAITAAIRAGELVRQGLSEEEAASQAAREANEGSATGGASTNQSVGGRPNPYSTLKRWDSSRSILDAVSPTPQTAHGRLERLQSLMQGEQSTAQQPGQEARGVLSPARLPVPLSSTRAGNLVVREAQSHSPPAAGGLGEIGEVEVEESIDGGGQPTGRSLRSEDSDAPSHHGRKESAFTFDSKSTAKVAGAPGQGAISPAQTPLGGGTASGGGLQAGGGLQTPSSRAAPVAPTAAVPPLPIPGGVDPRAVVRDRTVSRGSGAFSEEAPSEDFGSATRYDIDGGSAALGILAPGTYTGEGGGAGGLRPSAGPAAIAALARVVSRLAGLCGLVAEVANEDGDDATSRSSAGSTARPLTSTAASAATSPARSTARGEAGGAGTTEQGARVNIPPPSLPVKAASPPPGRVGGLRGMIEVVSAEGRRVSVTSLGGLQSLPGASPIAGDAAVGGDAAAATFGARSGRTTPTENAGLHGVVGAGVGPSTTASPVAPPRRLLRLRMSSDGAGARAGMQRQQSAQTILVGNKAGSEGPPATMGVRHSARRTSDFGVRYTARGTAGSSNGEQKVSAGTIIPRQTEEAPSVGGSASSKDSLSEGSSALSFSGEDVALLAALVNVLAAEYVDAAESAIAGHRAAALARGVGHSPSQMPDVAGISPHKFAQPLATEPDSVHSPRPSTGRRDSGHLKLHRKRSSLEIQLASLPFAVDSRTRQFLEQQTTSTMQAKEVLYGVKLSGKERFRAVGQLVGKVLKLGSAARAAISGGKLSAVSKVGGAGASSGDKGAPGGVASAKRRLKAAVGRSASSSRAVRPSLSTAEEGGTLTRKPSAAAVRAHAEGIIFHTESMAMPPLREAAMQFELPLTVKEADVLRPGWTNWLGFDIFQANRDIMKIHGMPVLTESAAEQMWQAVKTTYVPAEGCMSGPARRWQESEARAKGAGERLGGPPPVSSSRWCGEEDDELGRRFMPWTLEQLAGGRSAGHGVGHDSLVAVCYAGIMEVARAGSRGVQPATARNLAREIACRYSRANPYHNALHAADVTMGVLYGLVGGGLREQIHPLSALCMVLAASAHDAGHLGVNNPFLTATQHDLALRYNDRSPLENMHCATLFFLMRDGPDADVLGVACDDPKTHAQSRKLITSMVLHTDNSGHFPMVRELEDALEKMEMEEGGMSPTAAPTDAASSVAAPSRCVEFGSPDEALFLGAVLHGFDISNPARDWTLNTRWTDLVTAEFWLQGDQEKERELPIGPMNDRRGPVPKPNSSSGFATALVLPLYRALARFPGIDMDLPLAQLEANNGRAQGLVGGAGRPDAVGPPQGAGEGGEGGEAAGGGGAGDAAKEVQGKEGSSGGAVAKTGTAKAAAPPAESGRESAGPAAAGAKRRSSSRAKGRRARSSSNASGTEGTAGGAPPPPGMGPT